MPRQIHAVVEHPQHFDVATLPSPVDQEVPPALSVSRHVQDTNSRQDVIALPGAHRIRPGEQGLQGQCQNLRVDLCLQGPASIFGPRHDGFHIAFGLMRQANSPCRHRCEDRTRLPMAEMCARNDAVSLKLA